MCTEGMHRGVLQSETRLSPNGKTRVVALQQSSPKAGAAGLALESARRRSALQAPMRPSKPPVHSNHRIRRVEPQFHGAVPSFVGAQCTAHTHHHEQSNGRIQSMRCQSHGVLP
eukprot:scaffold115257_cov17-Tisochrysis_lutea.AAC.1